jgi:hypothetical protein
MLTLGLVAPAGAGIAAAAPANQPLSSVVLSSLGRGYTVLSQGPLKASSFANSAPNPSAASTALGELSAHRTISTYERVWRDAAGNNEVQILLVRFVALAAAQAYFSSVRQALKSGEIVSSGAMPGVKGAFRTTYFATLGTTVGVGQAVTVDVGTTVATLSFFSSNASSDMNPVTVSGARSITQRQLAALHATPKAPPPAPQRSSATSPDFYWILGGALGALLVIAGIVLVVLGRRRSVAVDVEPVVVEPRVGRQDIPILLGLLAAWLFRPRSKP